MPKPRPPLSFAPANALPMWSDGLSLFTELPGPGNLTTVLRYPLTATGLSQALALIRTRTFDTAAHAPLPIYTSPQETARLAARDNLRRLGIVPR